MSRQLLTLAGKISFITGSTRGIGWATARLFAEHGATVILNGRADADALQDRVNKIREEFGVPCIGLCADASNPSAVKGAYQEIFRQYKRLDVLVNNAGILHSGLLGMIPDETIGKVFETNSAGPTYHLQQAARLMSRNQSGSIINVTSIMGRVGNEGQVVYSASKAAVIGLTLAAAKELAGKNIRVNAVAPGFIMTDMMKEVTESQLAERVRTIKLGRIGQPEDVANAILFLASDLSSYMTGQVLGIDGGVLV